ncbi:MAG: hypothetical protein M3Y08_13190 [Fibrobacterota bacterium]|nr:hypothetical protein [Fibrobacterota bacterium]
MQISHFRFALILSLATLLSVALSAAEDKNLTLETKHYRVAYKKKNAHLAGEVLKIAEAVWPTLAKAYDAYDNYQRIDIVITDEGDDANGYAIYSTSFVAIYAPHMDWVMRNRQGWIENVVTHELAHVFTLRRAAHLSPLDAVELYGSTYNYADRINYSFHLPWVPLIAPTWYVEGIAQFEAYMNGNDSWDSQRDMVVRDAYLTGTLPDLDFIETFDYDEDWTQAERCYNTGYAFLIYLKDRFGADKVRDLAKPKPLANFSWSVHKAFGRSLPDLFEDFKRSLADRYADFKDMPKDSLADKDMVGHFQQDMAFSRNGKYMAWLGNDDDRRSPMNWIFWKDIQSGTVIKSDKPVDAPAAAPAPSPAEPAPTPAPVPELKSDGFRGGPLGGSASGMLRPRFANPALALGRSMGPMTGGPAPYRSAASYLAAEPDLPEARRSEELGSAGLEFNHDNTRLLTTRQDREAQFTDIWEYEFRSKKGEKEKWHRLTWEERATYPSYHPAKNLIVYSRKKSGSSNLTLLDSTGRNWQLTNFSNGEQVYNPRFTPKGDSIYFTLGVHDKEAIASINADAMGFNPFLTLKDSAAFPDSLNLAKTQKINFITPFKQGAVRNLRFHNDTLFWSSNAEDSTYSVYDVYARVPGDSAVYRATRVAGQALEPVVHEGTLYYQGYHKQQFLIFRQPLSLTRTNGILRPGADSLPIAKPKKEDYTKAFETGNYTSGTVALDITPFLSVQPVFVSGNRSYTDLALGLTLQFGTPGGDWQQAVSGAITKRTRLDAPLNYQFRYSGMLSFEPISHTRMAWPLDFNYSLYHDQVQNNSVDIVRGGFRDEANDSISFIDRQYSYATWSRYAASAGMPLPYNFVVGGNYFAQYLTYEYKPSLRVINETIDDTLNLTQPLTTVLRSAQEHRHFETSLGWGWSKSRLGTYLPTGIGVWGYVHRYWATYKSGSALLDTGTVISLAREGKAATERVLTQSKFDPWTTDAGVSGFWSLGRHATLFANAEAGAFLNKFPTTAAPAHVTRVPATPENPTGYDTTTTPQPDGGLWVLSYRLGYYKMSGYPYNFNYRGRDIMEGSSFAFGQYGIQVPIKAGAFLPGLPTTSFKQIMLTGLGEWGTTLLTAPNRLVESLDKGEHHLLLDFGARISFNFRLYHRLPFTIFAQTFVPYNRLKEENLLWFDYAHTGLPNPENTPSATQLANDPADRKRHMEQVQQPRFYVGLNLGLF